jgi:hypothetical protein
MKNESCSILAAIAIGLACLVVWLKDKSSALSGVSMSTVSASSFPWAWVLTGVGLLIPFVVFIRYLNREGNKPYELDWTVDNTALAYDPNYGCVLVAAENTHRIEGRDRHVDGNLPASIFFFDYYTENENLYVVDFYHQFGTSNDPVNSVGAVRERGEFHWKKFKEPMEVVPRGAGKNWSGALADVVAGYNYENYVLPKGTRPDISAPGVSVRGEKHGN